MADNYLITGYWGEPHVTAENDRGINAAIFGTGRFVLPVGSQFQATYIGNNTIRMMDGKLMDNGAAAGIPAGLYVDLIVPETGQGMTRNDIIAFKYKKDTLTLVETGEFVVVSGTESADIAADPELYQEDLMSNEATLDYMPLWRVPVSGATIGTPERLFTFKLTGDRIITANSTDGVAYTAHLHGVGSLFNGLEIIVIPNMNSTQANITLDLNGLGAKPVRMTLPFSSGNSGALATVNSWFSAGAPMTLRYHEKMNTWKSDLQRQSAQTLYGSVPATGVSYDGEASGLAAETVQEAIDEVATHLGVNGDYVMDTNISRYTGGALGGQFTYTCVNQNVLPQYFHVIVRAETVDGDTKHYYASDLLAKDSIRHIYIDDLGVDVTVAYRENLHSPATGEYRHKLEAWCSEAYDSNVLKVYVSAFGLY